MQNKNNFHQGTSIQSFRPYIVRDFLKDAKDDESIIDLFYDVFGVRRSKKHWHWQFLDNPYLPPLATLAQDQNSKKVVGHYTVMPTPLNIKGVYHLGAQALDTMVHPEHRRQGIMEETARHCFEKCSKANLAMTFAFPGPESYPGFIKKLNWQRVAPLKHFCTKIGVLHLVEKVYSSALLARWIDFPFRLAKLLQFKFQIGINKLKSNTKIKVSYSKSVPNHYAELWSVIAPYEVYSVWKDEKYFDWRYDKNTDNQFHYVSLFEEDVMVAMAVVVTQKEDSFILEFLVSGKRKLVAERLRLESYVYLMNLNEKLRRIHFYGHDNGFFEETFGKFTLAHELTLCIKLFSKKEELEGAESPFNWTCTHGDSDAF